jgi:hypothetical protein
MQLKRRCPMAHQWKYRFVAILALLLARGILAAQTPAETFEARITGFQEVPAIETEGKGTFTATLSSSGTSLSYTLTFTTLSTAATVAHIHIGQFAVSGGIVVFLCGGGGKPACPPSGGTVTGTITAADVMALPAQNVVAGDFAGLLRFMRAGVGYANVHSTRFPAGEIRGQIAEDP